MHHRDIATTGINTKAHKEENKHQVHSYKDAAADGAVLQHDAISELTQDKKRSNNPDIQGYPCWGCKRALSIYQTVKDALNDAFTTSKQQPLSHHDHLFESSEEKRSNNPDIQGYPCWGCKRGEGEESHELDDAVAKTKKMAMKKRCVWGQDCQKICVPDGGFMSELVGAANCLWTCGNDPNTPTCPESEEGVV